METVSISKKQHKFSEKAPIVVMLLFMVIGFVAPQILGIPLTLLASLTGLSQAAAGSASMVVLSLILFLIFWLIYRPDYSHPFSMGISFGKLLLLCVPFFVYAVISVLIPIVVSGKYYFQITVDKVLLGMQAGFLEEIVYRVIPIAIGMRFLKGDKRIWLSLLLTSVVFGLSHATNIFAGANPVLTVIQVVGTMFIGAFLGMIYLRTGSVLPTIIIHTLYDLTLFCTVRELSNGLMSDASLLNWTSFLDLGAAAALAAVSVWLTLRKPAKEQIKAIWDKKWHLA